MKTLGNIIWIITGGLVVSILWALCGLLFCITIVGIPLGVQCFKFAELSLSPFGKEVELGGGSVSTVANIFWLICCGIPMAVVNAVIGLLFYITIIGIPFGRQYFKLAKLSLMPFGAKIVEG